MIGIAGSTFAYNNISVLLSTLQLDITFEILSRIIILVLGLVLLIFNTMMYIKKLEIRKKSEIKAEKKTVKKVSVKEEKSNSKGKEKDSKIKTTKSTKKTSTSNKKDTKAAVKEEEVIVVKESVDESKNEDNGCYVPVLVGGKGKIWPFVISFVFIFIIMVLAFIPWADAFKINAFADATTAVSEFKLFGFPLFGRLLGTVNAFGSWAITDMFLVLAIVSLFLSFIYKVKLSDVFDGFSAGVKKALAPALVILLVYTTYHPFQLVLYKAILGITKGFNVFTSSVVAILAGLFNADPSYTFQSVLPYLTSVVTNTKNYPLVGVVFQSMYGFTMLFAPTSLILMGVLSYLEVSYGKWLKSIWKLIVELLIVFLIVLTILVLI